jgi:hypothetical protein
MHRLHEHTDGEYVAPLAERKAVHCFGKMRFATAADADSARADMVARGRPGASTLQTYICKTSTPGNIHFHVGHDGQRRP